MTTTYRNERTGKLMLEPESVTRARELREWNTEQETQENVAMNTQDTFRGIVKSILAWGGDDSQGTDEALTLLGEIGDICLAAVKAEDCNGWCNRETRAVFMWLERVNEFHTHTQKLVKVCTTTPGLEPILALANTLEAYVCNDLAGQLPSSDTIVSFPGYLSDAKKQTLDMFKDIGSLWRVDWKAIAEALVEGGE